MMQLWQVYVSLAVACFAIGLWVIPCKLLYKKPHAHYLVDECKNNYTLVPIANDILLDQYLAKSIPGKLFFNKYQRMAFEGQLVNNYAVLCDKPCLSEMQANILGFALERQSMSKCDVLVACGSSVKSQIWEPSETYLSVPCNMPYKKSLPRFIGVTVNCGDKVDSFFWYEGESTVTKMLHYKENVFVCSKFTQCTIDINVELATEFNKTVEESNCGTRLFLLKRERPLWLKLSHIL